MIQSIKKKKTDQVPIVVVANKLDSDNIRVRDLDIEQLKNK